MYPPSFGDDYSFFRRLYPFVPKSTAHLKVGQFWAVKLHLPGYFEAPNYYGCARVLQLYPSSAANAKRWFISGLMAWLDTSPPTAESIAGCNTIVQQYNSHIRDIEGEILGFRSAESDGLEPLLWLNASDSDGANPSGRPSVMRGWQRLHEASLEEHQTLRKAGHVWTMSQHGSSGHENIFLKLLEEHQARAKYALARAYDFPDNSKRPCLPGAETLAPLG